MPRPGRLAIRSGSVLRLSSQDPCMGLGPARGRGAGLGLSPDKSGRPLGLLYLALRKLFVPTP